MRPLTYFELGLIVTIGALLVGAVFGGLSALKRSKRDKAYKSCTKRVLARIEKIDVEEIVLEKKIESETEEAVETFEEIEPEKEVILHPTYKYWVKDDRVEAIGNKTFKKGEIEVGDMVPIYYDPKDVTFIYCPDEDSEVKAERYQLYSVGAIAFSIISAICFVVVYYVR